MTMKACAACPHQSDCRNVGDCLDNINALQLAKTHGRFPRLMTPGQASLFMQRLRDGATIRRLTGGGKVGKAIASKSKYENHCLDYTAWGAEAERLAKKNQHAAYVVTTTISWAKARQRSADMLSFVAFDLAHRVKALQDGLDRQSALETERAN